MGREADKQNELDFVPERSIAVHVNRGRPNRLLP